MSTNDLAATERVRPQSMFITVKSIEKAGLIRRRPHPTDGRQMLLELTRKGVNSLKEIFALREDWLTAMILKSLTKGERKELRRGLALIQKIVDTP